MWFTSFRGAERLHLSISGYRIADRLSMGGALHKVRFSQLFPALCVLSSTVVLARLEVED